MDHFAVKVENAIKENEICIPTYENGTEVFVFREPYQNLQAVRLKVNNDVDIPDKQTFGCYISSMTQSKLHFDTDSLGDVITVIPADLIPGTSLLFRVVIQKLYNFDVFLIRAKNPDNAFEELWKFYDKDPSFKKVFGNPEEYIRQKPEDEYAKWYNDNKSIWIRMNEISSESNVQYMCSNFNWREDNET